VENNSGPSDYIASQVATEHKLPDLHLPGDDGLPADYQGALGFHFTFEHPIDPHRTGEIETATVSGSYSQKSVDLILGHG
jgi:hypothetical protein